MLAEFIEETVEVRLIAGETVDIERDDDVDSALADELAQT